MSRKKHTVLFLGLGSIGRRHARILSERFKCRLYAFRHRGTTGNGMQGVIDIYDWKEAERLAPDATFVTNPTNLHIQTALRCARAGMTLFVEKPIGSTARGLDKLLAEVQRRRLVSYVAYNLRFHPVIRWLKDFLQGKEIYHVTVHNSSYLPSWRPGSDHRKCYSAHAAQGGGILLDSSHEFDYIEYLFGGIAKIEGWAGRAADVTVDADDCVDALITTRHCRVNLHMDCMSRHVERTLKIDCDTGYIFCDLNNSVVELIGAKPFKKILRGGVADTYVSQLEYFFDNIDNRRMMNSLPEASVLFRKIAEFREKNRGTVRHNRC